MSVRVLLLPLVLSLFSLSFGEDVTISVKSVTDIAQTDDNFVCATLDWWPPGKCNYGMCPWGQASILNLDLENPILPKAIKAFGSLRIRLGGSLQDQVVYQFGDSLRKCPSFKNSTSGLFGFSRGCLQMDRWDKLYGLLNKSGALVTFGLNALFGRKKAEKDLWVGSWNPANARDFINHTVSNGQKIDSWEFGNELCANGIGARVEAKQYGQDMIILKQVIDELYQNYSTKPKILGPGGFFDKNWFTEFLQVSGQNVVDGVTHHIYNLGAGVDPSLFYKMQDPYYLSRVAKTYKDVDENLKRFAPWSSAWVGESGGAYNSGGKDVSHAFVDSFWYLDSLGMTSTFNHKVFCRQTLIGGNYGLLNTTTMVPNPDYYSALLWHRLMGKKVLSTRHYGSPYLRAYSHCSKKTSGVTLLLINLSNSTSFNISVANDMNISQLKESLLAGVQGQREEYHLTPKDGNLKSTTMLLNGVPLELTQSGDIPALNPSHVDASSPISIAPQSIAFVNMKDFKAPAC